MVAELFDERLLSLFEEVVAELLLFLLVVVLVVVGVLVEDELLFEVPDERLLPEELLLVVPVLRDVEPDVLLPVVELDVELERLEPETDEFDVPDVRLVPLERG